MAGLTFDDLIPPGASSPGASALNFDDLTPAAEPLQVKVQAAPESPQMKVIRAEREAAVKAGEPQQDPYQRMMLQGASMGYLDEVLAGLGVPIQMVKRGTLDPGEAYEYSKANQNWELEDAKKRAGGWGTAAEIGGGIVSGGNLFRAGATSLPAIASTRLGGGWLGRTAASVTDGAAYGAIAGFGEGEDAERFSKAGAGAAIGATVGGAIPVATTALGLATAPILSNISALRNPSAYADRQLGRTLASSGRDPNDVADAVRQAAAEGQGEFRLMDALGQSGRRQAATVTRNPGPGREQMVEFFDQRQSGQGRRVADAVEEGLGASETAEQAAVRLAAARRAQDDVAFDALRNNAEYVDVMPVANLIDSIVQPGMTRASSPAGPVIPDSVEAILGNARGKLERDGVSRIDFGSVQRTRGDIADAADKAFRNGEGNKARLLRQVRDALDAQMEQASAGFRTAMANSREAARTTEAVGFGTQASKRGRIENNIAAFNRMTPEQQQAFRYGFADPIIETAQRSPMGTDASRPLTSLSRRTELPAFAAPGQGDTMMRRLGREADMFRTRHAATGNSSTTENLADNAATGIDPAIIGRLLAGDWGGAARNVMQRGYALAGGNTEEVRRHLAERLLNGSPDEIRALLQQLSAQTQARSTAGGVLGRSAIGGILQAAGP